ncbi:hypothetical protein I6N95_17590 [Vagococcus sp. BWB3-3]|uniref:Uncharacterized protein n=1 Tax=Vagococcus allomyrinae TaxID=2794353 RepID=A0A940PH62_9ENTE|nr:hypothetical protein [Vagococcus allomyrinae]MBP1042833.1 hypothetical protein [Vagococcus allomyrinae]
MDEVTTERLQLAFFNSNGSQSTISPKFFDETFVNDKEKLQKWMDDFSALELFYSTEKEINLYTEAKEAHLVQTIRRKLLG